MSELVSKTNYIGTKFFVQNEKQVKREVMMRMGILNRFSITLFAKDTLIKTYYDTADGFFAKNGINININRFDGKEAELVVRYSSSTPRIAFLGNMPDTFTKYIDKKDFVEKHLDFIEKAISELRPSGLNVDLHKKCKEIKAQINVTKKRERFKGINVEGLKVIFSFDNTEYTSFYNKNRQKILILEIKLNSDNSMSRLFYNFEHDLCVQIPSLIKLQESDLQIAQSYIGTSTVSK